MVFNESIGTFALRPIHSGRVRLRRVYTFHSGFIFVTRISTVCVYGGYRFPQFGTCGRLPLSLSVNRRSHNWLKVMK